MKLLQSAVGLVAAMMIATQALAVSNPEITGIASGEEFCFQFFCGAAAFAGDVQLEVDGKPRRGKFLVTVNHESPLPDDVGESVLIVDGDWWITTKNRVFSGQVTGGTITKIAGQNSAVGQNFAIGENFAIGQNFAIEAVLKLETGGTGEIYFVGTLSHEEFPFTIFGEILQTLP